MKIRHGVWWRLAILVVLIGAVLAVFASTTNQSPAIANLISTTPTPVIAGLPTATPIYQIAAAGPIPTYKPPENFQARTGRCAAGGASVNSIEELVAVSDIIVEGYVESTGEIIRDADTPAELALISPLDTWWLSQVYHFRVVRIWKGLASPVINVVQGEGLVERDLDPMPASVPFAPTQKEIDDGKQAWRVSRFKNDTRYMLFLNGYKSELFAGRNYWGAAGNPWRYELPDSGDVIEQATWCRWMNVDIPVAPTVQFRQQVERAVQKKLPPPPTATPQPTPFFTPPSQAQPGQKVNPVSFYTLTKRYFVGYTIWSGRIGDPALRHDEADLAKLLQMLNRDFVAIEPLKKPLPKVLELFDAVENYFSLFYDATTKTLTFGARRGEGNNVTIVAPPEVLRELNLK